MFFTIDPHNGVAIYEQVVRRVNFVVASEALKVGEMVPSVRQLARELAINPNTVARAYRELQSSGVLEAVRGTGLAVTQGAKKRCQAARVKMIGQRIRSVLEEAKQSRLEPKEIRDLVGQVLSDLKI